MLLLLFFAFIAGMVTIMAPCIWPLLPIILSASSGTGKQRPLGITLGIMSSFTLFTLSISYLEKIFHIDPNSFRIVAVVGLGVLGVSMMIPSFGEKLEGIINNLLSPLRGRIKAHGTGFSAGFIIGFATGLVWAPCSGPILAAVATLAATQEVTIRVVAVTLSYVSGLGIPLFLFSLTGSWCFNIMRRFTRYTVRVQQVFGVVTIAAALLIYTNYDKVIQLKILQIFPSYGSFVTTIEDNTRVNEQLAILQGDTPGKKEEKAGQGSLPDLGAAPEFVGISQWLNTNEPLTVKALQGKVVLVDFWTYTCINCVRTLPHVTAWYEKYKDSNFVIVGVHTPEFAFEKKTENVVNAIKQFKIHYPVAQDNDYKTWRAYKNRYWPAKYLIDSSGRIRKTHFGEGEYEEMEGAIRQLIEESGNKVVTAVSILDDQTPRYKITPETYLGAGRMERFASREALTGAQQTFASTLASDIAQDHFAYEGEWKVSDEAAISGKDSALEIRFRAEKVFLVMSPGHGEGGSRTRLFIDGKPVDESIAGADVRNGELILDVERLYGLIDLKGRVESHLLRLEFENSGISVYAFTFG